MNPKPTLFLTLTAMLLAAIGLLAVGIYFMHAARPGTLEPAATAATIGQLPTEAAAAVLTPTLPIAPTETAPPASTETPAPTAAPTLTPTLAASPTPAPITHTVQAGEVLFNIAQQYGVSVDEIMVANGLASSDIFPGDVLTIPASGTVNTVVVTATNYVRQEIGRSYGLRPIQDYIFGSGPVHVAFVGAIHGGYEWNTATLAYEAIDYFSANPDEVPAAITLHIIPAGNPDGIAKVTNGKVGRFYDFDVPDKSLEGTFDGRFNDRGVDLNRNWDCEWSEEAFWRDQPVDPGSAAFSEPENVVLRDYLFSLDVQGVVFWHSALGIVAPGGCGGTHPPSEALAGVYSRVSGYTSQAFGSYAVTGDASDWFASQGIPAITVELTDHENTEWENRNRPGMLAILDYFASAATTPTVTPEP